ERRPGGGLLVVERRRGRVLLVAERLEVGVGRIRVLLVERLARGGLLDAECRPRGLALSDEHVARIPLAAVERVRGLRERVCAGGVSRRRLLAMRCRGGQRQDERECRAREHERQSAEHAYLPLFGRVWLSRSASPHDSSSVFET